MRIVRIGASRPLGDTHQRLTAFDELDAGHLRGVPETRTKPDHARVAPRSISKAWTDHVEQLLYDLTIVNLGSSQSAMMNAVLLGNRHDLLSDRLNRPSLGDRRREGLVANQIGNQIPIQR